MRGHPRRRSALGHPAGFDDDEPVGEDYGVDGIVGDQQPGAGEGRRGGGAARSAPRAGRWRRGRRAARRAAAAAVRWPAPEPARPVGPARQTRLGGLALACSPSPKRSSQRRAAARAAALGARGPQAEGDVVERGQTREQQVVLEHHADRTLAPSGRTRRRRGRPGQSRRADRGRRRSAAARRWPAAAWSCRRRWARAARPPRRRRRQRDVEVELPSRTSMSAREHHGSGREPAVAAGQEHGKRHRDQHERERDRGLRSDSRARNTASGMVWVRPWRLPAKVTVAPNSPRARAQQSTAPATMDGRAGAP